MRRRLLLSHTLRLSRIAIRVVLTVARLGPPHLPQGSRFPFQPTFAGLEVLRDALTSVGPSSLVLSSYGLPPCGGARQISLGKINRFHYHPVTTTRADRWISGFAAGDRLTHRPRFTVLHLRSERQCTYGFYRTFGLPSALATSMLDSLHQGFQDRIFTSNLLIVPSTPPLRSPYGLPPIRTPRRLARQPQTASEFWGLS